MFFVKNKKQGRSYMSYLIFFNVVIDNLYFLSFRILMEITSLLQALIHNSRKFIHVYHSCINFVVITPTKIAIVKLEKVPISTYSVVLMSFALFNSPNLNIDLAANKKPTPSIFFVSMKVRIRIRSKYPMRGLDCNIKSEKRCANSILLSCFLFCPYYNNNF